MESTSHVFTPLSPIFTHALSDFQIVPISLTTVSGTTSLRSNNMASNLSSFDHDTLIPSSLVFLIPGTILLEILIGAIYNHWWSSQSGRPIKRPWWLSGSIDDLVNIPALQNYLFFLFILISLPSHIPSPPPPISFLTTSGLQPILLCHGQASTLTCSHLHHYPIFFPSLMLQ